NKALAGIRTVDPNNIVWYEPQQLAGGLMVPTYLASVSGENNLGLSWHNYCSATFAASLGTPLDFTESCTGFTANRQDNAHNLAYSYDTTTGLFTMSFTSDPSIQAPTRIFVSPLTAPHGYTVTTSAGTVTKNGSYVDLTGTGSGTVKVTITPVP